MPKYLRITPPLGHDTVDISTRLAFVEFVSHADYNFQMRHISSHWDEMLDGFDGSPEKLRGMPRLWPPITNPIHRLFQRDYIRTGRAFPNLKLFVSAGRAVARRQKRAFDLGMLRQCLALAQCDTLAPLKARSYVVIGDGYGALGSVIAEAIPNSRITFINLAAVLEIDRLYFNLAHPRAVAKFIEANQFRSMPDCHMSFDIACMGEVNPDVCNLYCAARIKHSEFSYSCNRVSKTLPDGTVTTFADYKWGDCTMLLNELCPWHQTFYSFRPPFKRYHDGPVQHCLVARPAR